MGALLDIKPPHLTVMATAWRAAIRLHQAEEWSPTGGGHTEILRQGEIAEGPKRHSDSGGLVWFTDGSKTSIGTGAGIAGESPRVEITHKLGHHVTAFQAEVFAIWACAKYNLERAHSGKHIYICSGSLAALEALHKVEIGSKLVRDCALTLRQLSLNNRVKLLWVPGHTGIPGTRGLTNWHDWGRQAPSRAMSTPLVVSTYALKGLAKDWLNQEFTRLWHNVMAMRHTRALFEGPSQKLGDTLSHLDKAQLRMLVGLVTGHWCEEEDETPSPRTPKMQGTKGPKRSNPGDPGTLILTHFGWPGAGTSKLRYRSPAAKAQPVKRLPSGPGTMVPKD
ncbi:uncharacterized protein LOC123988103 [Osmia bicornis bicornis]|uniref:uncharacterized protein LOC123988103 n=1 Tax=Osmia bicornis bicornis TaxID=1437191 RepID=UPI001EAEB51D|nr:uncharacterized protein LOC123988103 [Osmia bicornis bicornis]